MLWLLQAHIREMQQLSAKRDELQQFVSERRQPGLVHEHDRKLHAAHERCIDSANCFSYFARYHIKILVFLLHKNV